MQNISLIKQKILQYVDFIGISKYQFYQKTGITRGVLDKEGGISEDNITKFIAYCPSINLEWLLTGNGTMLKSDVVVSPVIQEDTGKIAMLERENAMQAKYIASLERENQLLRESKVNDADKRQAG